MRFFSEHGAEEFDFRAPCNDFVGTNATVSYDSLKCAFHDNRHRLWKILQDKRNGDHRPGRQRNRFRLPEPGELDLSALVRSTNLCLVARSHLNVAGLLVSVKDRFSCLF